MNAPALRKHALAAALAAGFVLGAAQVARADLAQVFTNAAQFSDWLTISKRAGFAPQMSGTQPHTVFAAENAAFQSGKAKALLQSNDIPALRHAILLQVVNGMHSVSDFMGKDTTLTTVAGSQIVVQDTGNQMTVVYTGPNGKTKAAVIEQPIATSNGIIYPVDKFF